MEVSLIMSYIWNVILSFSSAEFWHEDEPQDNCEALNKINEWLLADKVHLYGPLMDLTACANGNETGMSANVYGGGFQTFRYRGVYRSCCPSGVASPG